MRSTVALLALGALCSPAAAWFKRGDSSSWTPSQETGHANAAGDQNDIELGWSPKPTEAPGLRFARMNLMPRMDDYTLGPGTCGFVSSNNNSFTCISSQATCTYSDGFMGCCEPNKDCNIVKTTCIPYSRSANGACDIPDDFHTLCCGSSNLPDCFTWVFTTTSSGSKDTYTLLDCSANGGTATLLDYDPRWSMTHSFASTTSGSDAEETSASTASDDDEESATTSAGSETSTDNGGDDGNDGGGSSNTGAIVGGAVGGAAGLGLLGLAGFFLWRRNRNKKAANAAAAGAGAPGAPPAGAAMSQQSPPQGYAPVSPGGSTAAYPSGVPSNYPQQGGYQQPQAYDPHMSYQQGYSPQPGYAGAYSPQSQHPGQYPQGQFPQNGQYNQSAYAQSYAPTASPPPNMSPSPGLKDSEGVTPSPAPPHNANHPPAQELPAINPIGAESNRAELG